MDFQDSLPEKRCSFLYEKNTLRLDLFAKVIGKQQSQPSFLFMENIRIPGGEIASIRVIEGNRR
jgi:hypothetical protein